MEKNMNMINLSEKKCHYCCHVLSVFPICCNYPSKTITQYVCGRCKSEPVEPIWNRQFLFEELYQHAMFPCSYAECKKKLLQSDVQNHEKYCRYKTVRCPACLSTMKSFEIVNHMSDNHANVTTKYKNTSLCFTNDKANQLFVFQMEDVCFLVYFIANKIAVLAMTRTKYTKFDVEVSAPNKYFFISFRNRPVIQFEESIHCFACITGTCKIECHRVSLQRQYYSKTISYMQRLTDSWLKHGCLSGRTLRYNIRLIPDETVTEHVEDEEEMVKEEEEELNVGEVKANAFRKVLNCSYCTIYMAPPIFMCTTGHSVCNVCKPKMNMCPTCKASFSEARNYSLEDLAENVEVPCQNDIKGCSFLGISSRMHLHECSFRDQ